MMPYRSEEEMDHAQLREAYIQQQTDREELERLKDAQIQALLTKLANARKPLLPTNYDWRGNTQRSDYLALMALDVNFAACREKVLVEHRARVAKHHKHFDAIFKTLDAKHFDYGSVRIIQVTPHLP